MGLEQGAPLGQNMAQTPPSTVGGNQHSSKQSTNETLLLLAPRHSLLRATRKHLLKTGKKTWAEDCPLCKQRAVVQHAWAVSERVSTVLQGRN